jgi:hypothetical protein
VVEDGSLFLFCSLCWAGKYLDLHYISEEMMSGLRCVIARAIRARWSQTRGFDNDAA